MLILILLLGIGLLVFGAYNCLQDIESGAGVVSLVFGIFISVFSGAFLLVCINEVIYIERSIPAQIAVYQEENQNIETAVDAIVSNYEEFEPSTYEKLKRADIEIAVSEYPELKSNEIVKEQIKIYKTNSEKIKKLKSEQATLGTYKFWTYFGR